MVEMADPQQIATGIGLLKSALETANFLRGLKNSDVISAYFEWSGKLIEGYDGIEIEVHPSDAGEKESGGTQ